MIPFLILQICSAPSVKKLLYSMHRMAIFVSFVDFVFACDLLPTGFYHSGYIQLYEGELRCLRYNGTATTVPTATTAMGTTTAFTPTTATVSSVPSITTVSNNNNTSLRVILGVLFGILGAICLIVA